MSARRNPLRDGNFLMALDLTPEQLFWLKVAEPDATGCWKWLGAVKKSGHGHFQYQGKFVGAHRLAYEFLIGPIPDGLVLDHLCLNPGCVNPYHLDPVPHEVNTRRWGQTITHCVRGHDLNADPYRDKNGRRHCRTCRAVRHAEAA